MYKKKTFKKGFTLVEIVLALALISIVLAMTSSLILSSNKYVAKSSDEFDIQIDIRKTIEAINQNIRFSTVSFAVLDDHYNGSKDKLTEEWSYIGLSQDGTQILHYKWNEESNEHKTIELTSSDKGLVYELEFFQDPSYENQRIINYKIIVKKKSDDLADSDKVITEIKTELEAINAIHIVDRGLYSSKNAVALAYRTDETPTAMSQKAAIAMVLDTSGSMEWDMDGNQNGVMWTDIRGSLKVNGILQNNGDLAKNTSGQWLKSGKWYYMDGNTLREYNPGWFDPSTPSATNRGRVVRDTNHNRVAILRNQAQLLVGEIKSNLIEGDISIIPFSTKAIYKTGWQDIQDKDKSLKESIAELVADGGTNTGDGLRYAYHAFDDINSSKSRRNYLIILVDGVTTYYTSNESNRVSFYEGKEEAGRTSGGWFPSDIAPYVRGNGSNLDSNGEEYVRRIGAKLQNFPNNITTFVIGFSDKWQSNKYIELQSVNTIASAVGIDSKHYFDINNRNKPIVDNPEYVFWAKDEDSLENVFDSISQYIEADFWQVSGPDN